MFTLAMFTIFASMKYHQVGSDSITLGFFRSPFLWGACEKEATNALNIQDKFIHGGEIAVYYADAQAMMKVVVNISLEDEYINNLKHMDIVAFVLLTEGHRFISHIQEHITSFCNYNRKWKNLAMINTSQQRVKEDYNLQFLALWFSKYWRA